MRSMRLSRTPWIIAIAISLCIPLLAEVKVELKASKIVMVDGVEHRQSAEKAKPGDVIEYVAEYHNTAKSPVSNVVATLPVPSGMEYIPDSASPVPVMASTGGDNYAPVPLKRMVRGADGKTVEQQIPYSEYRSLRWTLGDLGGESSKSVKARMQVRTQSK